MITLVAGLSAATYAHGDKKSPDQRAKHMTKVLQHKLNLTADQATQVNAVLFAQASQMDSLNINKTVDRKANHFAKRTIMMATDQKLSSILNADQLKGYDAWKAARKEKMHGKKSGDKTTAPTTQG